MDGENGLRRVNGHFFFNATIRKCFFSLIGALNIAYQLALTPVESLAGWEKIYCNTVSTLYRTSGRIEAVAGQGDGTERPQNHRRL